MTELIISIVVSLFLSAWIVVLTERTNKLFNLIKDVHKHADLVGQNTELNMDRLNKNDDRIIRIEADMYDLKKRIVKFEEKK